VLIEMSRCAECFLEVERNEPQIESEMRLTSMLRFM
jgi:hypothetical protein